jgi:hypothetical protein
MISSYDRDPLLSLSIAANMDLMRCHHSTEECTLSTARTASKTGDAAMQGGAA